MAPSALATKYDAECQGLGKLSCLRRVGSAKEDAGDSNLSNPHAADADWERKQLRVLRLCMCREGWAKRARQHRMQHAASAF